MKVKELIKELEKEDPEEEIYTYDMSYWTEPVTEVYRRTDNKLYVG